MLTLNELLAPHQCEAYWSVASQAINSADDADDDLIFMEYYCENLDCDCQVTTIAVLPKTEEYNLSYPPLVPL